MLHNDKAVDVPVSMFASKLTPVLTRGVWGTDGLSHLRHRMTARELRKGLRYVPRSTEQ